MKGSSSSSLPSSSNVYSEGRGEGWINMTISGEEEEKDGLRLRLRQKIGHGIIKRGNE